jgi:nicotinate phosphoribosyltransferase
MLSTASLSAIRMSISPANALTTSFNAFLVRSALPSFSDSHAAKDFSSLSLTSKERGQLEKHCPYFKPAYLDYLAAYRFKPDQVRATFVPKEDDPNLGRLEMEASGLWKETILWEVPLMACLSETYFTTDETDWSYDGQAGVHRRLRTAPRY